jgi:hypothetical protein
VVPEDVSCAVGPHERVASAGTSPEQASKERSMTARVGLLLLFVVLAMPGLTLGTSEAADHGRSMHIRRDVVLYELTERAQFADIVAGPVGMIPTTRLGTSALQGKAKVGTPLCPEVLLDLVLPNLPFHIKETKRCVVTATGHSTLHLVPTPHGALRGRIRGDLAIVLNTRETNPTDAAELIVMTGEFNGAIEVTDPAIINVTSGVFQPTALINGLGQHAMCARLGICRATFTGKFRLPFKVDHHAVYKTDNGHVVRVLADERALGDPTVRLEVTFD